MKIYVNEIMPEGMNLEEEISPSELNLETEQVHYPAGINVKAHAKRDKDIITVECDIKSMKKQICSRCLSEFELPVEKGADFVYKLSGKHVIDLNDNIRDTIILDYPIKMLCKPDCKGLCPHCGKNLNEGSCNCKGGRKWQKLEL